MGLPCVAGPTLVLPAAANRRSRERPGRLWNHPRENILQDSGTASASARLFALCSRKACIIEKDDCAESLPCGDSVRALGGDRRQCLFPFRWHGRPNDAGGLNDAGAADEWSVLDRRRQRSSGQSMAWAPISTWRVTTGRSCEPPTRLAPGSMSASRRPASGHDPVSEVSIRSGERGRRRLGGRKNVTHVGCF